MDEPRCKKCPAKIGWTQVIRGNDLCARCRINEERARRGAAPLGSSVQPRTWADYFGNR